MAPLCKEARHRDNCLPCTVLTPDPATNTHVSGHKQERFYNTAMPWVFHRRTSVCLHTCNLTIAPQQSTKTTASEICHITKQKLYR